MPEDSVRVPLAEGRLVRVLEDWCPPYAGYRLYRPSRRQPTPAFASLVNALRYRDGAAAARGGLEASGAVLATCQD
ncbi:MAG TPA: hypothetical protein VK726_23545 [Acetobacteraceae bacterium]|nr:hypothetical protein [Acetobacteraceae bacterium]